MPDPTQLILELLRRDRRYKFEAYAFVYEALAYAHETLKMGGESSTTKKETRKGPVVPAAEEKEKKEKKKEGGKEKEKEAQAADRHLTGQQLCEAIRLFAQEQYGLMAKNVLNNWGVKSTSDFGEIVYNLIELGLMRKTDTDRREDFNDVYDFETGFLRDFKISLPEE